MRRDLTAVQTGENMNGINGLLDLKGGFRG